jgi:hypothetical protein
MTIYSSINIEGEIGSSSENSAILENDQLNDQIDRTPLLGDSIPVEDENNGTASNYSCTVG